MNHFSVLATLTLGVLLALAGLLDISVSDPSFVPSSPAVLAYEIVYEASAQAAPTTAGQGVTFSAASDGAVSFSDSDSSAESIVSPDRPDEADEDELADDSPVPQDEGVEDEPAASPPADGASAQSAADYPVNHVVFNGQGIELFEEEFAQYVKEHDSFMLVSGNNDGIIDTEKLNAWAAQIRDRFGVPVYAATSGLANIDAAAAGLDSALFDGVLMVYEPNQENAPEFSWDSDTTMQTWATAAQVLEDKGLTPGGKPSGRALAGRDKSGAWDYGALAGVMDVLNVQTQGSCRKGNFAEAIDDLLSQRASDAELFVQVSVGSTLPNHVPPADAIECAQYAWGKDGIERVTLWMATERASDAQDFYELREDLLAP